MSEIVPVEACSASGCKMQARVAIRSQRVGRTDLKHTLHMDNRTAPKAATRYCTTHGARLMADLANMADADALMPGTI